MIKVGDYIKHKDNGMIYKVVSSSEKLLYVTDFKQTWQHIGVDVATNNFIVVDYKQLYEQQKQRADELEDRISEEIRKRFQLEDRWRKAYERADELEKRWSELVDVLMKKYEYYKVRADDESAGPVEQNKWNAGRHEVLMVLKLMTDLKRGETE